MAIGPAMILGLGGILALVTLGRKSSASPGTNELPPGQGNARGGSAPKPKPKAQNPQQPIGPIPISLPEKFATLLARALNDMTVQDDGHVKGPVTAESIQRATTVAAQLEQGGFPQAANALRAYISMAAKKVPSPPIDKQVRIPGVSPAIVEQVNRALKLERDPTKLRAVLDGVKKLPASKERDALVEMLGEAIKQTEAALIMAQALSETEETLASPGIPQPRQPTPTIEIPLEVTASPPPRPATPPPGPGGIQRAPAEPQLPDTAELRRAINVSNHLRNLQQDVGNDPKKMKGKEDKGQVVAFQKQEGITADGKAGPTFMTKLAKYTGNLPLVLYWPKSATQNNVFTYRENLRNMADIHERAGRVSLANALRASAARERGQAGIVGTMPA
jgi:hypothetical protein